jgi:hypothetical protein
VVVVVEDEVIFKVKSWLHQRPEEFYMRAYRCPHLWGIRA